MSDFDRLVALETKLAQELGEIATIDRHDFGLGNFNIFALAEDPATTFTKAHRIESFRKRSPSAHAECSAVGDSKFFGRTFDGIVAWGHPDGRRATGRQLLGNITELTGGRPFTVENPNDLPDIITKIRITNRCESSCIITYISA